MFKLTRTPIAPVRREPVRLPITATLAVPDDDCIVREAHIFNVPGAIHYLMGSAGWERLTKVTIPRIWAPAWSDSMLADFVTRPFPKSKRPLPVNAVGELRVADLLPSLSIRRNEPTEPRHIIHLLASFDARDRHEPTLRLESRAVRSSDDVSPANMIGLGQFRDALVADDTRLLILQVVDLSADAANAFAQRLAGSGGPARVVVTGGTSTGLDRDGPSVHFHVGRSSRSHAIAVTSEPSARIALG